MKKIYKKYYMTVALIWAGCFAVLCSVYVFVLLPQKKSKQQIANVYAQKKQMCEYAQRAAQAGTKLQLNQQLERMQNKFENFVVDFEDAADLTFDISQIATEKKVSSFTIKNRNKQKDSVIANCDNIYENHIDIGFKGSFNQFAGFMNSLERNRPVVFVDSFAISRSRKSSEGHKVNMSLGVFVKKQQDS